MLCNCSQKRWNAITNRSHMCKFGHGLGLTSLCWSSESCWKVHFQPACHVTPGSHTAAHPPLLYTGFTQPPHLLLAFQGTNIALKHTKSFTQGNLTRLRQTLSVNHIFTITNLYRWSFQNFHSVSCCTLSWTKQNFLASGPGLYIPCNDQAVVNSQATQKFFLVHGKISETRHLKLLQQETFYYPYQLSFYHKLHSMFSTFSKTSPWTQPSCQEDWWCPLTGSLTQKER